MLKVRQLTPPTYASRYCSPLSPSLHLSDSNLQQGPHPVQHPTLIGLSKDVLYSVSMQLPVGGGGVVLGNVALSVIIWVHITACVPLRL